MKNDLLEKGAIVQRDRETYALVPHFVAGLITPEQLRKLADVAEKYNAKAIKITAAQRMAIVGFQEDDIDNVWNGVRQIIIFEGLMAKYSQNPELGEKLKATGNAILAEAAVNDRIWGIGLSMKDPKRLEPKQWNGQNLLGYATMLVREKLSK